MVRESAPCGPRPSPTSGRPLTSSTTAPVDSAHQHSQEQPTTVRAALRTPRQLKTEIFGGIVVALALIPESISFSILAGVPPQVGLFASFTMAVTIAFVGGRPAMISAATGAIALVIAPVALKYGLDYFIAAVILAGCSRSCSHCWASPS